MLDSLLLNAIGFLFGCFIIQLLFVQYYTIWFYSRQGVGFCRGIMPVLGNLLRLGKVMEVNLKGSQEHPGVTIMNEDFKDKNPKVVGLLMSYKTTLMIRDCELVNELYTTKNRYFDKHHQIKDLLYPLMGESILLSNSTTTWSDKRKSLSKAFYKDKLVKMVDIVKHCMADMIQDWKQKYITTAGSTKSGGRSDMDLVLEISQVLTKVILSCTFGQDISDNEIDYYIKGINTTSTVGKVLRECFHKCLNRQVSLQIALFPNSGQWCITAEDRENRKNIIVLRQEIAKLIQMRREGLQADLIQDQNGDLLSILLNDELFKDNDELIVDECITFFFAGSQTTSITLQNEIYYLMQQPHNMQKVKDEIKKIIIDPYKAANPGSGEIKVDQLLTYENTQDLTFFTNCFMESMRIEPAVSISSPCSLTETVAITDQFTLRAGQSFCIDMMALHHNEEQWKTPDLFIPERFDPASSFFLTSIGKKRHPMSFGPFLGGKRICLGKTFAETISKIIGPTILAHFDFEFVDPTRMTKEKPLNNLLVLQAPVIMVKVREVQL